MGLKYYLPHCNSFRNYFFFKSVLHINMWWNDMTIFSQRYFCLANVLIFHAEQYILSSNFILQVWAHSLLLFPCQEMKFVLFQLHRWKIMEVVFGSNFLHIRTRALQIYKIAQNCNNYPTIFILQTSIQRVQVSMIPRMPFMLNWM